MNIIKSKFKQMLVEVVDNAHFVELEKIKKAISGQPLVLYGCGQMCKVVMSICELKDIKITAICDSNRSGHYENTGYFIISPKELIDKYYDAIVLITSQRYENEITEKLCKIGFSDNQIYPFPFPHTYVMNPKVFEENYLEGFEKAYDFFKDDVSREIILDRMRMHILGTRLIKTTSYPTYFEPNIINLHQNEVFVDAGCYKGETVEEFVRQMKIRNAGDYLYIYSFEPDAATYEIAINNLKDYKNVEVIAKGLWSDETVLKFFSDGGSGGSSFVLGQTSISIPVTSLDKFFEGKPRQELPTFIKMDIEGAEREALIGATNIIKKNHPKLAICVYHKPEDIFEIPQLIYEIDSSYKFSLHQCADGVYDTVLFAV